MSDNELIAAFMGQHVTPVGLRRNVMQKSYYADELKYDTSWDWLMPVVEKIEKIKGTHTVISELGCDIYSFGKRVPDSREVTKIKTVYKAVVEFIKWYNAEALKHKQP